MTTPAPARVTPPPECRFLPEDRQKQRTACRILHAEGWNGCPTGFTSGCNQTVSVTSHYKHSLDWSRGFDDTMTPLTVTERWQTAMVQVICCPDALKYECDSAHVMCTTHVQTQSVLVYTPPTTSPLPKPTTTTLGLSDVVQGYAITAAFAEISLGGLAYAADDPRSDTDFHGGALTTWCSEPLCADIPRTLTTQRLAVTAAADEFRLQAPPDMGKVGPMGIFAITALFGAILFAVGMLAPWAWLYRQRRLAQRVQSQ
ncbi:hypothetical protein CkaCkLH20_11238 [Colletotrichum karsti]|uniref:Uncharacterized protein n=1 Tax=Colletotrichum karsti TaxID=1095194 RepID=A0A9P6HUJ2_9PEZI|nr:uncharacterized protein CkaCkLH20_11238 [Colletotrichum karsti]KAF9871317.1 hypothetical protein CkaCkLH20_11238 [Colletotrichum karsti]